MKSGLPRLNSDEDAEAFVETADLSEFDLSHFRRVRFELEPKIERDQIDRRPD